MFRIRKITLLIVLPLWLGALSLAAWAAFLPLGKPAPNFHVKSGSGQKLSLHMLRGKVIVLFYEFRDSLGQNDPLKDMLKQFYRDQPASIRRQVFRLVVVDCSSSIWATAPIWRSKLREHSRIEGFTIYGDWTGKMLQSYRMKLDKSNFLIIDKHGIVRYSTTGRVNPDQFRKIKKLLLDLIKAS
jgi:predicted transcriptional regulator